MKKTVYIVLLTIWSFAFSIPKNIEKKINKEIKEVFHVENFNKELITVAPEIQNKLFLPFGNDNFYKIFKGENRIGYYYFGTAPSKTDYFNYMVIFDEDMIIKKIKVLAYREDYGGEISSKRWLNQFNELSMHDNIKYQKDIKAISGATISARSMTKSINDLLKSLVIIQNKNL